MTEFTSEIKIIPYSDEVIFPVLSDLSKLELVRDRLPEDKLEKMKNFSCDRDSFTVSVDPVGSIRFVIVEREPNSTIKLQGEKLPFDINMWVQLKAKSETETAMKLTVKVNLNPFLKPMLSKPLQEGIAKVADTLARLPYDQISSL
ncbi:hypothetical protein M2132_000347 [Dysgonomonas sp. PH5-45]|uniref:SRPBCC family protein n=1 Tax=unclassified Dysgonomonas TaxID=2630389 RepID=UPI002475A9BB|nr:MULTISPECIES: SRPBCC family protein [unclassified Dysgonomonas]MDH6354027.1 hypothetical protein [Dysgonomonas sp. PH5-45]MDH6386929.1 hypothetical protein [Dysgonomonas sp. PH5-37]